MIQVIKQRSQNVQLALAMNPGRNSWFKCVLVYLIFLVFVVPIGIFSGFFHYEQWNDTWFKKALILVILFIAPSFLEELFFRVILLPHPREGVSRARIIGFLVVSVLAFVIWHPLNSFLFCPAIGFVFTNPIFLVMAGLFGLASGVAYQLSGSVWPSVIMHWITVAMWIQFLGGREVVRATLGI